MSEGEGRAGTIATPAETQSRVGVRGRRIYFVDLLRLVASLQMVHGHTLDALMAEELRSGPVFERWSWGRGLVSVAFMVAAGFSFQLSTLARFESHRADRIKVRRRFRRGFTLIALGYLLHFPVGAFSPDPATVHAAWVEFATVDVLHCIGLCILVLEALTIWLPSRRAVVYASALLAIICFAAAPLGERVDPSGNFRFLLNLITHQGGSLFPALPWAGFVFAGLVAAEITLPEGTRTEPGLPVARLLMISIGILATAAASELVPWSLITEETSRNSHPAFNVLKLGCVLAIVTLLAVIGRQITKLPRVLTILAGETLILYVSHLMVLYGSGVGLYRTVGRTLDLPSALLVAAFMVVATASVGLVWFRMKRTWKDYRARR